MKDTVADSRLAQRTAALASSTGGGSGGSCRPNEDCLGRSGYLIGILQDRLRRWNLRMAVGCVDARAGSVEMVVHTHGSRRPVMKRRIRTWRIVFEAEPSQKRSVLAVDDEQAMINTTGAKTCQRNMRQLRCGGLASISSYRLCAKADLSLSIRV